MQTLKLELKGLISGYFDGQRMQYRLVNTAPHRQALIGMIACAMGVKRGQTPDFLGKLKIEIKNKNEHTETFSDFHTIEDAISNIGDKRNVVTHREYIIEPDYIVEITGDDQQIGIIKEALHRPKWQLYLGRKCCVPEAPILALCH